MLPPRVRAGIAVLIPTTVLGLHGLAYGRWIVDDAAITFAYARSITSGAGPVLQAGVDPVEGYSNPAWLGLLSLGRLVGLFDSGAWFGVPDYALFPKALALLLAAGAFAAFHVAASALTSRPAVVTIAAGTVTALVPSFAIWTFSGLENSLLAFSAVAIAAVLARAVTRDELLRPRTAVITGLLAAIAALTRPDGLIYAGTYALVVLILLRRDTLREVVKRVLLGLAVFAVPVGLYLVWRWLTFGALLPNTALAKSQGVPTVEDLAKPADMLGYVGWLTLLAGVVLVGAALLRPSPHRNGLIALAVPLGLAVTAYGVLAQDWMAQFRFATPVWPLAALTVAVAGAHVLSGLAVRGRVVVAVVGVLGLAQSVTLWWDAMDRFRTGPTVPTCVIAQIDGWEFNTYARLLDVRDGSLLVPDIGGAALTSELEIIDLAGLAHRRIAELWSAEDMAGLRDYVFTEAKPTFITAHGTWAKATGLFTDPRMTADYELIMQGRGNREKWVRRDAVPDPARLAAVRAAAQTAAGHWNAAASMPRGSCGPVLRADAPYWQ
ncbi:hypothetical protein [Actinokineospora sp. UTMC 2448]|uniref:hypothetical protein n=1 Tax=Actinokineospora sp. UTMC 2448 TaxID=2268449 RepID=UPI002164D017|nr:hypothetical protein [Actinokineospora sp. UTMC 2448]UVS81321.1 hypothetical protein Actkin_05078 [Actinokineospora sp. UTMC 2448]